MENATLIVFRFRSLELPYQTKRIYLTEYHKRKRCYQGWSLLSISFKNDFPKNKLQYQ